jgi:hypothetical protein
MVWRSPNRLGEVPPNIVLTSAVQSIDMMLEGPSFASALRRLAGLGRLICLDNRGHGASDPVALGALPTQLDGGPRRDPGRRRRDLCAPHRTRRVRLHGDAVRGDPSRAGRDAQASSSASSASRRSRASPGPGPCTPWSAEALPSSRAEAMPDPARAVAEMARVVRPGGLVCLADSDWATLDLDVGDPEIARRVRETFGVDRARQTTIGGRLSAVAAAAGLVPVGETSASHVWSEWDPDESPRLDGWAPRSVTAAAMVEAGQLSPDEVAGFVENVETSARLGRFIMRLTMRAVVARRPWPRRRDRPDGRASHPARQRRRGDVHGAVSGTVRGAPSVQCPMIDPIATTDPVRDRPANVLARRTPRDSIPRLPDMRFLR